MRWKDDLCWSREVMCGCCFFLNKLTRLPTVKRGRFHFVAYKQVSVHTRLESLPPSWRMWPHTAVLWLAHVLQRWWQASHTAAEKVSVLINKAHGMTLRKPHGSPPPPRPPALKHQQRHSWLDWQKQNINMIYDLKCNAFNRWRKKITPRPRCCEKN